LQPTAQGRGRVLQLIRNGSLLEFSVSLPQEKPNEFIVNMSIKGADDSLPIPSDSGWIEFGLSAEPAREIKSLMMVANTKMTLQDAIAFYDRQMSEQGWLARTAGREVETDEMCAQLPYVRGQRDVVICFQAMPEGYTRITVG